MKISIYLEPAEVKGLTDYVKQMDGDPNIDKALIKVMIKQHIQNIVHGTINSPKEASSGYIEKYN